jgi:hypothetical protein
MISLKKLLTEDKNVKIYVQKGKKPPKGKTLKKGPRGGQYFVGTPGEKQSYEGGKTAKTVAKPKVNIFNKPKQKVVNKSNIKIPANYTTDNTDDMANVVADNFAKLIDRKTLPTNWEEDGLDKKNVKNVERFLKSVFKPGEENEEFDDQFLENFWDDFATLDTQAVGGGMTTVSGGQAVASSPSTIVRTRDRDWLGDKNKKGKPDLNKIKDEYAKIIKKNSWDVPAHLDYLKKAFPKIDEDDLEEALYIQQTFESSAPEGWDEMHAAQRDSKWFDKFMGKHPELEKIGFDRDVVYDPKDM